MGSAAAAGSLAPGRACALALAAAIAPAASALPVDSALDLTVGEERFLKFASVLAVETDAPQVATAEILPGGEVLVTGRGSGRALLFLADDTKTAAWRLRVRESGAPIPEVAVSQEARAAARRACPGLKEESRNDAPSVAAVVATPACRRALKRLFEADGYRAERLELTFSIEALQDQLADLGERLAAHGLGGRRVHYSAVTLVVDGALPRAALGRLARAFYEAAIGRVPADLVIEEGDAGAAAPPSSRPPTGAPR